MNGKFIPESQLKQIQKKGLAMVLYFDTICKEKHLTYFLCGGCCIGAVRHRGFIPWDDDVDVFMPRKDYEKLKKVWKDTNQYSIQYPDEKRGTANQFITICDNNTTFIKSYQKDLDINHGLVLDVLPLDGCPQGLKRKIQKVWALLYSLYVVGKAPTNHGKALYWIGKFGLMVVPFYSWRYRIWKLCEKRMSKYSIEDCDYITELCSGPKAMQFEYPKKCFSHAIPMEFEGIELNMPADYDTYLKIAFGDYMKLPPQEEQVCHHELEFIDMDRSYLNYKGKKYFVKNRNN